jgi:glycosyltransferase involved in cell wall biosynthesis
LKKKLTYFGILKSITSWAKVSRELISALLQLGVDINIYERKGFLFEETFGLDYSIKSRITNEFNGDIVFTFENPRAYKYLPTTGLKIGFLVYEFTVLPEIWVENIQKYLDIVVVPSNFCKEVFVNAGIQKEKIKVLRYGFNPEYYYPASLESKQGSGFSFLCCSAPHKREGVELLLESFTEAFSKNDKVELNLKLTYRPGKNPKSFEYENLDELIKAYLAKPNAPKINVIYSNLSELEMGNMYRNADIYFSMSKGEAFGLCFLEALACGKKVISTDWGGQKDFLNGDNAYFVKHSVSEVKGEEYEKPAKPAFLAVPDVDSAAKVIYDIYDAKLNKGCRKALLNPDPSFFHWDNIAKDFLEMISDI